MFFHFQLQGLTHLRQTVLLLNTVLLIVALIVIELVYSETPTAKRRELRYFYPFLAVLTALLVYAIYIQRSSL